MTGILRAVIYAAVLAMALPSSAGAQAVPTAARTTRPDFTVHVVDGLATDFTAQVGRYYELRRRLEAGLPAVIVTDDVRQIRRRTRSLATAIRVARAGAVQGEFFTPGTTIELRQGLAVIMTAHVWAVIMEDNPGAISHAIDGAYPDGTTRSTMPGVVLAQLPALPDGIEFRFAGPDLILYDVRANTIIDRLPDAIQCRRRCGDEVHHEAR
jgi:hypothetical protein